MNSATPLPNSILSSCGQATSWAYLYRSGDAFSTAQLYDLSQMDWDYSEVEPCGQQIDNIDGVISHYCCETCQHSG